LYAGNPHPDHRSSSLRTVGERRRMFLIQPRRRVHTHRTISSVLLERYAQIEFAFQPDYRSETYAWSCPSLRGPTPTRRCCGRAREADLTILRDEWGCLQGARAFLCGSREGGGVCRASGAQDRGCRSWSSVARAPRPQRVRCLIPGRTAAGQLSRCSQAQGLGDYPHRYNLG
jgi:hypothetical protein